MQVLVCDDSRSSLAHLKALRTQCGGLEVEGFANPEAARATQHRFDPVCVDALLATIDDLAGDRGDVARPRRAGARPILRFSPRPSPGGGRTAP